MSKAILFFADGLEECEGLLVVDLLRRAGITVQTVSVSGRAEVTSSHNVTLRCDAVAETADLTDADAVVLPGGMPGTTHLAESALVARTVRSYAAQGKLVAAICAAPSVLGGAGADPSAGGRRQGRAGSRIHRLPALKSENFDTRQGGHHHG